MGLCYAHVTEPHYNPTALPVNVGSGRSTSKRPHAIDNVA